MKRKNKGVVARAKDYEHALRMILATVDESGRPQGKWHGLCVRIARAAVWRNELVLPQEDYERIKRNMPPPPIHDDAGESGIVTEPASAVQLAGAYPDGADFTT